MSGISLSQSQAWRRMHRLRSCPPLDVLRSDKEAVQRHLAGCPVCRDMLENGSIYDACGQLLARCAGSGPVPTPVERGDIRRVRPADKPGDWFDARGAYHNPPLVLALEKPDAMGFVRVAQIFEEPDLAAAGDVPLYDDAPVYAEAWNVYALPLSGLAETAFRHVGLDRVEKVSRAARMNFPDLDPSGPLYHFRSSEVELGSFFSSPLNAVRLEILENNAAASPRGDALERKLKEIGQKAVLESLPLAAAECTFPDDGADRLIRAVGVLFRDGLEQYPVIPAEAHLFYSSDGCVCAAYCKPGFCLDADPRAYGARLYMDGIAAGDVTLEWPGDGTARVHGKFSSLPDPDAEIRVVFYELNASAPS